MMMYSLNIASELNICANFFLHKNHRFFNILYNIYGYENIKFVYIYKVHCNYLNIEKKSRF